MAKLNDLEILTELVKYDTNSNDAKNYIEITSFIKQFAEKNGGKVNIYSPEGKQKPNLIAEFDFGKEITIGINAHYDTVPVNRQEWKTDPFKLTVSGGKAFGRGASDDKAGIAIALSLIQSIKSNVNIELIITCDEEIGSADGLKWLIQNKREKIKSDAVIVLDAEDKIIIGASGVASGRILIKGSEVHAGFPFLGKNAISIALPFLDCISKFQKKIESKKSKFYGDPKRKVYNRFSITMINSGIKENLIPGSLEARFDLRCIPEMDLAILKQQFIKYFNAEAKKIGISAKLEFTSSHNSYVTDTKSRLVKKFMDVTKQKKLYASFGGLDANLFTDISIPTVSYGVENSSIHKSNEYVEINRLTKVRNQISKILETY